ncbi:hypothetical protein L596_006283 [Steinernema carpocapsae]|uniref:Uncharacterized protein n=1 Tax=Steinernema carpocapsae TaxID=34508 RepID=A0A4U8V1L2_STECR|nr:hypothetical protein L596_006283 [Steinernema carpocapsae]
MVTYIETKSSVRPFDVRQVTKPIRRSGQLTLATPSKDGTPKYHANEVHARLKEKWFRDTGDPANTEDLPPFLRVASTQNALFVHSRTKTLCSQKLHQQTAHADRVRCTKMNKKLWLIR